MAFAVAVVALLFWVAANEEKEEGKGEIGVVVALAAACDGDKDEDEDADETTLPLKETLRRGAVERVLALGAVFLGAAHPLGVGAVAAVLMAMFIAVV